MKLHALTVGPIVGETTPNRVRIWGRGQANVIDNLPRRCFGALRFRPHRASEWQRPRIFKMNPNFDLTGIAILDGLKHGPTPKTVTCADCGKRHPHPRPNPSE